MTAAPNFKLSHAALADIDELLKYIGEVDPASCEPWLRRLWQAFGVVGSLPNAGHHRPELSSRYRVWSAGKTMIIYRPLKSGARIMRVVDGRRNLSHLRLGR